MTAQQRIERAKAVIIAGDKRISETIKTLSPIKDWPEDAPDYLSPEGWAFEKKLIEEKLKQELTKKR